MGVECEEGGRAGEGGGGGGGGGGKLAVSRTHALLGPVQLRAWMMA